MDLLVSVAVMAFGGYGFWTSFHPGLRNGKGGRGGPASTLDRWVLRLFTGALCVGGLIWLIRLLSG